MSGDYWLGVATLPALALAVVVAVATYVCVVGALDRHLGISFEAKVRDTSKISDYTLRHNIWWERSFGPVFIGGWYREPPCVMAYRARDLGMTAAEHLTNPTESAEEASTDD